MVRAGYYLLIKLPCVAHLHKLERANWVCLVHNSVCTLTLPRPFMCDNRPLRLKHWLENQLHEFA